MPLGRILTTQPSSCHHQPPGCMVMQPAGEGRPLYLVCIMCIFRKGLCKVINPLCRKAFRTTDTQYNRYFVELDLLLPKET